MTPNVLYNEKQVKALVKKVSKKVTTSINSKLNLQPYLHQSYPPVMVCVLNGGFMFFKDLVSQIKYDCEIDFIRVKSYKGTTQENFTITKNIETDITNKIVYIIDDFFDSGNTIEFIINELKSYSPFSIIPVTLFKRYNSQPTINLIYGETINSDEWLVGYGLNGDHNLKRNLPYILGYPKGN